MWRKLLAAWIATSECFSSIWIYNVEKYLQKCIDSILAQTYRHLEIILVDDGSPDNCGAICDNYAQEDGRVLVIHKKNGGLSSARNAGLEIAKGELIVFIDSDDWIDAQNGAVIASVMSELTTNIIQFLYLKRKIKYHISNTALVLSLFSTMVMAAVVCAIIKMNLPLAVALAMEISIGGAIYLLMNIALKNRILSEMLTKVLKKHNTGFQDS
ncbi:MAG: glycosyltransferase [Faecalibacterium prausnitzii]|nr:glycosyltransferase [Faecalibacterium prausnitzii]